MATLITKNSSTASAVPAAGDLVKGELAVNVTDKKVYTKDNSAAVVKLVGSLGNQEANAVAITGGAINGTTIGATTPSTGAFTTASASSGFTGNLTGNVTGNVSGTAANVTGVVAIANGGTGLSALGTGVQSALGQAVTGSGSFVLSTSPSLTTPNLGTPSAAMLTNATGLPLTTGVTGTLGVANGGTGITAFGTGVATALGQNVTGSGGIVLATSPSLTTPNLGTPSAATLTNATGLPISTGVSGLGTGVATALGVAVGSAGAFVVNGGALGTPSSGTVTNLTGTASININGTVGATTPTTGAFTTLSASGNITVSGGTANGVAYLNGSKVLTTGSALTFTGTNLGIGVPSPTVPLDVNGSIKAVGANSFALSLAAAAVNDSIWMRFLNSAGTRRAYFGFGSSGDSTMTISNDENGAMVFQTNATEGMRLTPTSLYTASGINVGIGTSSPSGIFNIKTSNGQFLVQNGTSANQMRISAFNNAGNANAALIFEGYSSEYGRFDSSGNLGLGVTPSAWNANNKSIIQLQNTANLFTRSTGLLATSNVVYNSADTGVFQANGYGLMYQQNQTAGTHVWLNTPNNTSGAGATASLTSAMTLDASGNLLLNTTSNSGGHRLVVSQTNASGVAAIHLPFDESTILGPTANTNITMGSNLYVRASSVLGFSTNNTERARITSGGGLWVGNTTRQSTSNHSFIQITESDWVANFQCNTTTAANNLGILIYYAGSAPNGTANPFLRCDDSTTTRAEMRSNGGLANYSGNNVNLSDRREKTNFAPAKSYLDTICAIPVQTFNYIDQSEDDPGLTLGVVAQDVQAVAPELVMESNWGTKDDPKMRLSIYQTDLQYALMKCIQELKAQNDDLRARVAQLEAK